MQTFKRSVSLSSKELTERKSSQVIYCDLNKKRRTNRTHVVNNVNGNSEVSSKSHHDKLRIIRGKEVFLRKFGNQTTQVNIHNQTIQNNESLEKTGVDDYAISTFNTDAPSNSMYPAADNTGVSVGISNEDYVYNLDINENYDNEDENNITVQKMTSNDYDTYQYFKNYPYTIDSNGDIDYSQMQCKPFSEQQYTQASTTQPINRKPKTLVGQKLTLENADEFCQE